MLISNNVTFKGNKNGITIVLKEEISIEKLIEEISDKISINKNFFTGDNVKISFSGKRLAEEEEVKIINLINNVTGLNVKRAEIEPLEYVNTKESREVPLFFNKGINLEQINLYDFCEGMTKFYQGTLRSGQNINYDGNVVILGDINAGAEVSCSGNIVVIGFVKGVVHAGAKGDEKSVVIALGLQPVQLRIAGIITRSPDGQQLKVYNPEIAYVKDNSIFIENLETRVKL